MWKTQNVNLLPTTLVLIARSTVCLIRVMERREHWAILVRGIRGEMCAASNNNHAVVTGCCAFSFSPFDVSICRVAGECDADRSPVGAGGDNFANFCAGSKSSDDSRLKSPSTTFYTVITVTHCTPTVHPPHCQAVAYHRPLAVHCCYYWRFHSTPRPWA